MVSFILTLKRLVEAFFKLFKDSLFRTLLVTIALILLSGTLFFYNTEGWSLLDSFYFAFISLIPTSVSTGFYPTATFSKWFLMIYLIVGMGIMVMLIIRIGLAVLDFEKAEESRDKIKRKFKK